MSQLEEPREGSNADEGEASRSTSSELTHEDVYDILSDKRRRYAIHYLKQRNEPVRVQELAEQVAAWENEKPVGEITAKERKRVYVSLYQGHLSTLDEKGLVRYDSDRGTVEVSDAVANTTIYLEFVPSQTIPWGHFYAGLSVASGVLLALAWYDVGLLERVPLVAVASLIPVMFGVSALLQIRQTKRLQLGEPGPPPELD